MTLPFVNEPEFHGTVNVASSVKFGERVVVWQFATICHDVEIGSDVVIGSNVWIGAGTKIGDGTRIQHGAFIPNNTVIGNDVFIGPNATLTDDKHPRADWRAISPDRQLVPPILGNRCALGAGCVILPGVLVGYCSTVGAGAVVTKDVFPFTTVVGCPAEKT